MAASSLDEVRTRMDAVTGACVLFRHGSRSLSGNAVRGLSTALDEAIPVVRHIVTEQWGDDTLGMLNSIGMDQMAVLGGWTWTRFLEARAGSLKARIRAGGATVVWGSSPM